MEKKSDMFDGIDKGLVKRFFQYHQDHPEIYKEFKRMAFEMRKVRRKYSHVTIMESMRWNKDLEGGEVFKINNDYKALYARAMIHFHPEFKDFFELRQMKSTHRRSLEEQYRSSECNTL